PGACGGGARPEMSAIHKPQTRDDRLLQKCYFRIGRAQCQVLGTFRCAIRPSSASEYVLFEADIARDAHIRGTAFVRIASNALDWYRRSTLLPPGPTVALAVSSRPEIAFGRGDYQRARVSEKPDPGRAVSGCRRNRTHMGSYRPKSGVRVVGCRGRCW